MGSHETRIGMGERHVREAEAHIARQYELIEHLHSLDLPTSQAESFLRELRATLRDHRRDLGDVIRQRDAGVRDEGGNLPSDHGP